MCKISFRNNINLFVLFVLIFLQISAFHAYKYPLEQFQNPAPVDMELDYYPNGEKIVKILQDTQNVNEFNEEKPNDYEDKLLAEEKKVMFPKQYIVQIYSESSTNKTEDDEDVTRLDSWSVIWYIASFGGLIAFFLLVSCSEWCCRRHARNNCSNRNSVHPNANANDTPPPPYDQFAPPSYDSLTYDGDEKREYDVYVVPVHTFGAIMEQPPRLDEDEPPSYLSAARCSTNRGLFHPTPTNMET